MNRKQKDWLGLIAFFLGTFIYIPLVLWGFEARQLRLEDCQKTSGKIADIGVDYHYSSKGGKYLYFYLSLNTVPSRRFEFSEQGSTYDALLNRLDIGDSISIYSLKTLSVEARSNYLVQIEKEGEIILDKQAYKDGHNFLLYAGFFGVLFQITGTILIASKILRRFNMSKKLRRRLLEQS